mmetsp:Transcript_25275/g.61472  ORF Transcript_25275/g.61472 Transcript_25275/m.61472 type:complete len:201 (+) Transcript_25275:451-1053(+)
MACRVELRPRRRAAIGVADAGSVLEQPRAQVVALCVDHEQQPLLATLDVRLRPVIQRDGQQLRERDVACAPCALLDVLLPRVRLIERRFGHEAVAAKRRNIPSVLCAIQERRDVECALLYSNTPAHFLRAVAEATEHVFGVRRRKARDEARRVADGRAPPPPTIRARWCFSSSSSSSGTSASSGAGGGSAHVRLRQRNER